MIEFLDERHQPLLNDIQSFMENKISGADLKHTLAPFGIYQQRNDKFMTRIRFTGGHVTVSNLREIARIMERYEVGFAHLTTRQDIQLHDVPVENVYQVVRECTANDMPFLGGGGNTFRNILVESGSGFNNDQEFDVMGHARRLNQFIFSRNRAFELPRKLKIGFSSNLNDAINATVQDLGFIAKIIDDRHGFEVYGGGGMGRESAIGVKLFDFLPEDQLEKCAEAMINLFHEHGDRQNRNQARIRFIVKRLGAEKFISLFMEYFLKAQASPVQQTPCCDYSAKIKKLSIDEKRQTLSKEVELWARYATTPTRFGDEVKSVRLFVPQGNLTSEHLGKIADLIESCGSPFVRITTAQDMIIPLVHASFLSTVYSFLANELGDIDLKMKSFEGHIVSCVGSSICKIGILDTPEYANPIARSLDEYFGKDPEKRASRLCGILDAIRISGCPNSCGAHHIAAIGLEGRKKKINSSVEDVFTIFRDGSPHMLAQNTGSVIPANQAAGEIMSILSEKNFDLQTNGNSC